MSLPIRVRVQVERTEVWTFAPKEELPSSHVVILVIEVVWYKWQLRSGNSRSHAACYGRSNGNESVRVTMQDLSLLVSQGVMKIVCENSRRGRKFQEKPEPHLSGEKSHGESKEMQFQGPE